MPELTTLALFMAAALAVNLTPGPDILYIAARSTSEGRASGVLSVVGITIGCLLHTVAAAVGLSALIAAIPAAYDAVRLAGAAYLLYLGARALVAGSSADSVARPDRARLRTVFAQGVLTNISNPKVALFFMAFLPQFVDPRRGHTGVQMVVLGLLFSLSGSVVNLGVALTASLATSWLRSNALTARLLRRVSGTVFIGLGLRLALSERR
jgi:threonine/homoserine/homoserine lactone efflux protein